MSDRRVFRWATTSARLLAATLVSTAAVIGVVTAVSLPWPTVENEPVTVWAVPAPAASVVVCDGGLLTLGSDVENAGDIATATAQTVTGGVIDAAVPAEVTNLAVPSLIGGEGPTVYTAQPEGRDRTDVAASGSASVTTDDLAGYAASACRPPLMESWLVAGSAATGAADIVLLSNPGGVAATVQLTTFGATGAVTPPGGVDVVVPAGTQRQVPLAGLVLGEEAPVIRVSAIGAPVHASLQASIMRTLVPGGVDQVGAVPAPETTQTIPGVAVTETPGDEGASDAPTVVRLLSPTAEATATVTVTEVGGVEPALEPQVVPLAAGQPGELELAGLPIGDYVVEVAADHPVVAAVWQTTGFGEGADFAWYTASPLVTVPSLFATPLGPPPVLTLANPTDEFLTVSITSEERSFDLEVGVPAAGSIAVPLSPRTLYELDPGEGGIRAGISLTANGMLAGFPVWPADAAAPPILVYPE